MSIKDISLQCSFNIRVVLSSGLTVLIKEVFFLSVFSKSLGKIGITSY